MQNSRLYFIPIPFFAYLSNKTITRRKSDKFISKGNIRIISSAINASDSFIIPRTKKPSPYLSKNPTYRSVPTHPFTIDEPATILFKCKIPCKRRAYDCSPNTKEIFARYTFCYSKYERFTTLNRNTANITKCKFIAEKADRVFAHKYIRYIYLFSSNITFAYYIVTDMHNEPWNIYRKQQRIWYRDFPNTFVENFTNH